MEKRKADSENRVFKNRWEAEYMFIDIAGKKNDISADIFHQSKIPKWSCFESKLYCGRRDGQISSAIYRGRVCVEQHEEGVQCLVSRQQADISRVLWTMLIFWICMIFTGDNFMESKNNWSFTSFFIKWHKSKGNWMFWFVIFTCAEKAYLLFSFFRVLCISCIIFDKRYFYGEQSILS